MVQAVAKILIACEATPTLRGTGAGYGAKERQDRCPYTSLVAVEVDRVEPRGARGDDLEVLGRRGRQAV